MVNQSVRLISCCLSRYVISDDSLGSNHTRNVAINGNSNISHISRLYSTTEKITILQLVINQAILGGNENSSYVEKVPLKTLCAGIVKIIKNNQQTQPNQPINQSTGQSIYQSIKQPDTLNQLQSTVVYGRLP